jgi:spore germination protein
VLVAVGPEWAGESPQWAVYDLHALGQVADRVLLMTYDEHANPGAPGPVAGLGWVSSALRYAMTQVSPARLLLGIADYGYDWSPGQAATVTAAQALALARQMGAAVAWDAVAQEPHFTYLQGTVRHTVWFEDGASAALKIALAQRDGLGGIALWQLGGEGPGFWNRIAAYRPAP